MAAGDKLVASKPTTVMNNINSMRAKWGITNSSSKTFTSGTTKVTASDINTMLDWIAEGKTKSGWTGSIPSDVVVGNLVTDILDQMITTTTNITNHCPCNCNYCSCNCNHCSCNCNNCNNCAVNCDQTR